MELPRRRNRDRDAAYSVTVSGGMELAIAEQAGNLTQHIHTLAIQDLISIDIQLIQLQ